MGRQQDVVAGVAADPGFARPQPEQPTDGQPTIVGLQVGLSLLPPSLDLFAIAIVPNSRERAQARHQDQETHGGQQRNTMHDQSPPQSTVRVSSDLMSLVSRPHPLESRRRNSFPRRYPSRAKGSGKLTYGQGVFRLQSLSRGQSG